jgi:Gpi18-like mannosyltransferase
MSWSQLPTENTAQHPSEEEREGPSQIAHGPDVQEHQETTAGDTVPSQDGPGRTVEQEAIVGSSSEAARPWLRALKQTLPIYTATHLLYLILSYVVFLFNNKLRQPQHSVIGSLIETWHRWDTGHFITIATRGYIDWWRTAFFPLYPLLIHVVNMVISNAVLAGLIVSNLTGLGALVVFYRLVDADFGEDLAYRSVLYYALFPMGFFLAAAYSESLFMLLTLSSFYAMRRGHWWLAGLAGLFASLTRAAAVPLLVPFAYEYLRQHHFRLRALSLNVLGLLGIPLGIALFSLYCFFTFHDPLAFSHAEAVWDRKLAPPWMVFTSTFSTLWHSHSHLNFTTIHDVIDLSLLCLVLALVFLGFYGPWRFRLSELSYALYGAVAYLFFLLVPAVGNYPTMSLPRYALAVFPAFVTLAAAGKRETVRLHYLIISTGLLVFSLLQFLTGQWAG